MDIWKWVYETQKELIQKGQSHERLAYLIYKLPSHTVDEEHIQVDALVPEALALARATKNPWLEVFIRHWNLQSKIAHRSEVTDMLPEAVSLLEFANREETRDCPQSICSVQDLTICYDRTDGPAYVEERLAAAKEALAKIDATWACFTCISSEYAGALVDGKQYEEALNFMEQQTQALLLANQYEDRFDLRGNWVEALINLERYEEAHTFNQDALKMIHSKSRQLMQRIDETRILAYLDRYEEAQEMLPDFTAIAATSSHYISWADATQLLVKASFIPNDWHLNAKFQQMRNKLSHQGVIRQAFTITLWQAEFALKRNRLSTAKRCCDKAKSLISRLRKPLDAPQLLEDILSQIANYQTKQSTIQFAYESPEQLLENLGDDPELAVDVLENARQYWPEHEELVLATGKAYIAIGEYQYSLEIFKEYLNNYPDSPMVVLAYGFLLLDEGQDEELQSFAFSLLKRDLVKQVHLNCHWLLALHYHKNNEVEPAKKHLSTLVEQKPNAVNARTLLAQLEHETGHLEIALQHLDWLVESHEEAGSYDWNRLIIATLLEDWDKVRQSAERLGFDDLPKNNPIDEEWEICRIQFTEKTGEHTTYIARRTGPVTARVLQIASPDNSQHFSDTLVFAPFPLIESQENEEETEQNEENQNENISIYTSIQVTKAGNYTSYILDGIHPGEESLQKIKETLKKLGCHCQVQSGEGYQLSLKDDSEPLLGLYAYIAVPETQALQEVADLLATTTQNYSRPLIWPTILEELGHKEELEQQVRAMNVYTEALGIT
ncbi:hypothetical protein [Candidatus Parabeggiatoa sp. HSG14]|uniref:tetratricopeptide repeat protein n=1 Tax=Candidatus Parabeggiatoa sp. HSG14 TaxID=3055593 RepID=UPI0025A7A04B|nr:hypothetical protein [Thiotrichales bacterium HSG14]